MIPTAVPDITDEAGWALFRLRKAVDQVKAARKSKDEEWETEAIRRLDLAWASLSRLR